MKTKKENKYASIKFHPPTIETAHLRANVLDNLNYFQTFKDSELLALASILQKLNIHLEKISDILPILENSARNSDYDENVPGNGFWSYLHMFNCALKNVRKICKQLTKNRTKLLFNRKCYST